MSSDASLDCASIVADSLRWQEAESLPLPWTEGSEDEKHSPYIVLNGTRGYVVVGKGAVPGDASDQIHPMEDNPDYIHFIQTMWVEDQTGRVVSMRHLSPAEPAPATMFFDIPAGATSLRAFELCNLHGLWRSEAVAVPSAGSGTGGCALWHCEEGTAVSACQAFTGELQRRENYQPKTDPTGKHTPFLLLNGTTATIVVGIGATPGNEGGLIHPMSPSDDKDIVHWISHLYAVDDLGNLVALCELLPTDPAPATCTFEVPPGIVFLRPYEFCNVHGLYIGDVVQVSSWNSTAQRQCQKRECSADQPSLGPVPFRSEVVEALAQQQQETADRISSINMCLQHMAVYYIRKSSVSADLQADIDLLAQDGDAASDVARRVTMFPEIFAKLNALGGRWSARDVIFEHTMKEANGTQPALRLDLVNEVDMRFTTSLLSPGSRSYAEGVNTAILDVTEELLLINANFAMDWGYANSKALGPHYTVFYTPDFLDQSVNVTLCAKTHGWMGIGWLNPNRGNGPLMQDTDMVVAYVQNGEAVVQDRFARWIEEPLKDEQLGEQRSDDAGNPLNGANDLELIPGALGVAGQEWCPDSACSPGFSLVQFRRPFATDDASDITLPVRSAKIGLIFAFARSDPFPTYLEQHFASSTGYVELTWNLKCEPGTYFVMATTECKLCDKGSFRPANTSVYSCIRTPPGTFQNETGQAVAKKCKEGFTTLASGATNDFECVCPGPSLSVPRGRYHVDVCNGAPRRDAQGILTRCARLGNCIDCPQGMICNGARDIVVADAAAMSRLTTFCASYAYADTEECTSRVFCDANPEDVACDHAPPELMPGYWSDPENSLSVLRCKSELHCLGGLPGSVCAAGREGIACGWCRPGYFGSSNGTCQPCQSVDSLPGWIAVACMLVVALVLARYMRGALVKNSRAVVSVMIIAAQAGVLVQTLGVFSGLSLVWEEPVKSLLGLMQLANFDLGLLKIQCHVGTEDPLTDLIVVLLAVPTLIGLGGAAGRLTAWWQREAFSWPRYLNAVGLVFMVFYLAICMAMTRPIHCRSNPNGQLTMVSKPGVVCWTPDHAFLATLAILGLGIFGIGFFAYILQIVWRYPSLVNRGYGLKLLTQYRFLFHRFTNRAYYWGPYFVLQKLMVALVPILFANTPASQILLLSGMTVVYLVAVSRVYPWATELANTADVFLNTGLVFFLLISAFFVDASSTDTRVFLSAILMALVVVLSFGLQAMALQALWRRLFPGKNYDFFLCHHKAGAAVLCRWLKGEMLQQSGWKAKVFLDSDELEGLADIGDIVKSQTSVLVIVATKLVLSRPWCAVEITSASRSKIETVLVKCSDFSFYGDRCFRELREGWTSADLLIFAQNAMDPDAIEDSYRQLPSLKALEFDAGGSLSKQKIMVSQLLLIRSPRAARGNADTRAIRETRSFTSEMAPDIVVLGAFGSSEGRMTCQVLCEMVTERTRRHALLATSVGHALQAARTAQYILVVLTAGLLRDETFLSVLKALDTAFEGERLEIVSALADQNFEFASAAYFQELSDRGEDVLIESVRRVINILALPFSPQTSIKVMSAQADEICRRFRFQDKEFRRQVTSSALSPVKSTDARADSEKGSNGEADTEETNEEILTEMIPHRNDGTPSSDSPMPSDSPLPMGKTASIDSEILLEPM